jgi:predicted DsbA family dithiol-disulfide isomerase
MSIPHATPRPAETAVALEATLYTDPLCAWSWAFEPSWRRLRLDLGARLDARTAMVGMIPDWDTYRDSFQNVRVPAQIGPLWREVQAVTGMPVAERIWNDDPPASSYPAGLAVAAAALQGPDAAASLLRRLREALFLGGRNIARPEVLVDMVRQAGADLDADRLLDDLTGPEAAAAFRLDLDDARRRAVNRYPAVVLRTPDGRTVLLVGFRPVAALRETVARLAPGLAWPPAPDPIAYATRWRRVLDTEVALACEIPLPAARHALHAACEAGALRPDPDRPGVYESRPNAGEAPPTGERTP